MPLDMVAIGHDKNALLEELRACGAFIKNEKSHFPCPFHSEKTASAHIHQDDDGRWRFHCFGCGVKGDVLDIKARREGRDLNEVIKSEDDRQAGRAQRPSYAYRARPGTSLPSQSQDAHSSPPPQPAQVYDDLDTLQQAAVFKDGEHIKKEMPDFEGRRVLARTFGYKNPDTDHLELIVMRLEGAWEESDSTPRRKTCLQAFQRPDGKFEMRRPPGLAPLFRRKELRTSDTVIVVEGEPKVMALFKLGFIATCSPGGSQAANKADWSPLSGKKLVIIWRDKDKLNPKTGRRPGLDYQNEVIAQLENLPQPPQIKVVDVDAISVLPENGSDVVDLIKQMGALPDAEQKAVIQGYLDSALPTGAHAELLAQTEEILSGERNVVDWPWPTLSDASEAITGGKNTIVCGAPGSSKSLLMLQVFFEWFKKGISGSVLMLEDDKPFHLRRVAAMTSGCAALTSLRWQKRHADETRKLVSENVLTEFGRYIHVVPRDQSPTVDFLIKWVDSQVQRGIRVIAIDPVTFADFGKDLNNEDNKLIRGTMKAVEGSLSSFIAITHPRPGSRTKTLEDMALTRGWGRHYQTALWYEVIAPVRKRVHAISGALGRVTVEETINRIVHVKKSRNTGGQNMKIGYWFDSSTLMVKELGEIAE